MSMAWAACGDHEPVLGGRKVQMGWWWFTFPSVGDVVVIDVS
jgi:hypothetical protein